MNLQNVSEAVQAALQKDLPNMVGEELRAFIEQAQKNERELEMLRQRCIQRDEEIEEKNEKLAKHRSFDEKLSEIASREKKLAEAEIDLLRKTVENKAVIAEEKLKTGMEIMGLALRNVEIRRHAFGNDAVAVPATPAGTQYPGSQGANAFAATVPTSSTVTETQE